MNLPDGWRFMPAHYARAVLEDYLIPLNLEDTFTFDCVGGGPNGPECCGHSDNCHGDPGHEVHQVGSIPWIHTRDRWVCPWLAKDGRCLVHINRPISCRMFPIGMTFYHPVPAIALWKTVGVERTCEPCHHGRTWTVEEWLVANNMEKLIPKAIGQHRPIV